MRDTSYTDFSHIFKNFENMKPLSDNGYESDSMHSSSSGEWCPSFLFFSFIVTPLISLPPNLLTSLDQCVIGLACITEPMALLIDQGRTKERPY